VERGELLERDAELRTVEGGLAAARAGTGSLITISASAGLGKTRLLAAAADLAGADGVEPLAAGGSELQSGVPFGIARELLERALRGRADVERERLLGGAAAAARPVLEAAAPDGAPADAAGTLLGLYWLVANLADHGPLVLLVDDLQWADARSVDLLEFLAPRLRDLPVLLVAAARPPVEAAADLLARLEAGAPERRRIELPPLSLAATAGLLRARTGRSVAKEFAAACHAATGGNPFYLGELAHELAAQAIAPTRDGAAQVDALGPGAIARATLVRLLRVSPDAVAVARTLAILGDGAPPADVVAHAGLDERRVGDALAGLVREAVLADERALRFAHPIVRAAIVSDLTAVERGTLHARAATILHERGAEAEQVALHLLEADPGATGTWAAERLRSAATAARERGAPGVAAALLRRALAEPDPDAAWEMRVELGAAAFDAGEPDALDHLREAAAAAPDAASRAEAALAIALPLVSAGAIPEAVETLRRALGELGDDGELAEELRAQLSAVAPLDPGATGPVMRELEASADMHPASAAGRRTLANLAQWMAMQGAPAGRVAELAERALGQGRLAEDSGANAPSFLYATFLLIAADHFDAARLELDAAIDLAQARGSVSGFTWASMMRSLLAYREGALDDAVADAQIATDVADQHGWGAGLPMAVGFLVDALIEQGRLDEARDALRRGGVADEVPDTLLAQAYLVARGRLAIARGELPAAVEHLEELARRMTGEGWSGIVGTPTYRTYLAPALAALGEQERAATLAEEEVELAHAWGAQRAIGTALRVRGVVAGRDGGAALLAEAAEILAGTPARLERARALADLGAALRRDGQASAAREPLKEAIDLAHRCGAAPLEAYAQDELAATGARRRSRVFLTGVESLTPSERRIAGMAAEGLSNGEIAQALFLTRKTIEMHLGNTYRKLDIRSRADLPVAMSREAPGS
jgi:DNA-binding CsgD family transcriptional regulator